MSDNKFIIVSTRNDDNSDNSSTLRNISELSRCVFFVASNLR